MQPSGVASVKRKYTCSECAKTFRNAGDMHLHAEECLLDAFEMEAHALFMNQGYCGSTPSDSPVTGSKRQINDYSGGYQTLFRPYVERRNVKRVFRDEVSYSAPAPRSRRAVIDALEEDEDELDYEETESEAPPQLELAEPHQRKYKRVFPIGEDGKQIRPKMECPTCGLVLYRHNFSTHYRIHTGELPFTCSFCDKRFRTSSALTVHTRCHTGDKPYNCPHCEYCCITKRNLDRHIINNHVKRRRVIEVRGGLVTYGRTRGRPPTYRSSGTAYGPSFGPITTRNSRKAVVEENFDMMHLIEEDKEDSDE